MIYVCNNINSSLYGVTFLYNYWQLIFQQRACAPWPSLKITYAYVNTQLKKCLNNDQLVKFDYKVTV